jgi:hypothetical protein
VGDRSEAEWDAEIEADFRRTVAATKAAGRRKRGGRMVGAPVAFLAEVCRRTKGRAPLAVALLIYRRTVVCGSRTVTVPGAELVELGITRQQKYRGLARLEAAGIIRVEKGETGRAVRVALLWQAS